MRPRSYRTDRTALCPALDPDLPGIVPGLHMRQHKRNINYIGNAFPHNFADAGDDERGCMIIEWSKPPTYHA